MKLADKFGKKNVSQMKQLQIVNSIKITALDYCVEEKHTQYNEKYHIWTGIVENGVF